jgi:hydrogenase maturation factor
VKKVGILDRIEGNIAIIEMQGTLLEMNIQSLPTDVTPGDVLIFDGEAIRIDHELTQQRKKEIKELVDDLFQD